jgi:hypothetical protein
MFHRWAALVLVLALCAMSPKNAAGQTKQSPRGHGAGALGTPYPNPFNPEVHIVFTVGDSSCASDAGQQHDVSIRIMNVLAQQVAIPALEVPGGITSTVTSGISNAGVGSRTPVSHLRLGCGTYSAYWDGNVQGTTKEAASGTYLVVITIDGLPGGTKRIFNRK